MSSNTIVAKEQFLQTPEFERKLDRLAEVAVHTGLGLGPGQELVMTATLDTIHQVVTHNSLSVETLIVDDDSSDDTIEVARKAAADFPALHLRILMRKRLAPGPCNRAAPSTANTRHWARSTSSSPPPIRITIRCRRN